MPGPAQRLEKYIYKSLENSDHKKGGWVDRGRGGRKEGSESVRDEER